jgi:hypothetical protein
VQNSMGAKRNNCGPLKELTKHIHWQQLPRADLLQRAVRDFFLHLLFAFWDFWSRTGCKQLPWQFPVYVCMCVCVFKYVFWVSCYVLLCLMFFQYNSYVFSIDIVYMLMCFHIRINIYCIYILFLYMFFVSESFNFPFWGHSLIDFFHEEFRDWFCLLGRIWWVTVVPHSCQRLVNLDTLEVCWN